MCQEKLFLYILKTFGGKFGPICTFEFPLATLFGKNQQDFPEYFPPKNNPTATRAKSIEK